MAAADGVVYGSVVDLPSSYATATERVGTANFGLLACSNASLATSGDTLLAGAGLPLIATQHAMVVGYQLGAR